MDQLAITRQTYDRTTAEYAKAVQSFVLHNEMKRFLDFIPAQGSILDLGCGSGRDAKIFSEKNYEVIGLDFSSGMVKEARKNAPLASIVEGDMRDFDLKRQFDGIWIVTSMLHIPREHISRVFTNAYKHLKTKGILFDSEKLGEGETFEPDTRYGHNAFKFFTYFNKDELISGIQNAGFVIKDATLIPPKDNYRSKSFLEIFAQKPNSQSFDYS